jgi:fibronectin-binding autotransporter adhesin
MLFFPEISPRRARASRSPASRARKVGVGPCFERLEDRIVLASDYWIATGATGVWSDGNNWSDGVPPTSSDTAVFSGSTAACVVDIPVTIDSLQVDSDYSSPYFTLDQPLILKGTSQIQAVEGSSFTITAGSSLTNDGTLTVALTSVSYEFTITGGGTVNNDGTLVFTGAQGSDVWLYGAGTTLNNNAYASLEFSGDASLTGTSGTIVNNENHSTISKTAGTGQSDFAPDTFENNGGTLGVSSGTFTIAPYLGNSTGGTFSANSGGVLEINSSSDYTYTGTYTGSGSGTVEMYDNDIMEIGTGGATFNFPPGLFHWNGTFDETHGNVTNTGSLLVDNYEADPADLNGPGQLINHGTIDLAGTDPRLAMSGNATLVNAAGGVIDIEVGSATIWSASGILENAGTLRMSAGAGASSSVTASLDSSGPINVQSGTLNLDGAGTSNYSGGTFTVSSGASLLINPGSYSPNIFTGTFVGLGGGTVSLGSFSVGKGGATVNFAAGMLQWLAGSTINTASGTLTNSGTLTIPTGGGAAFLEGGGTLINDGTIVQLGNPLELDEGSTLSNTSKGVYDMEGISAIEWHTAPSGTFVNAGLLSKTTSYAASITTAFSNTGQLQVSSGTLSILGTIVQDVGNTLNGGSWTVTGTATSPATLEFSLLPNLTTIGTEASVTLSGPDATFTNLAGLAANQGSFSLLGGQSLTTPGSFTNSGELTLSPGSVLTVDGSFTQTSAGQLTIQIGGTSSSPTIGSILATGTVTLAGGLTVTAAVQPAVGTALVVVNNQGTSPISGIFANLPAGSTITVNGMTFRISYVGGSKGRSVTLTRIA